MPTYKVTMPYVLIDAPDALAARIYYNRSFLRTFDFNDITTDMPTNGPVDVTVDVNGDEIEQPALDPRIGLWPHESSSRAD